MLKFNFSTKEADFELFRRGFSLDHLILPLIPVWGLALESFFVEESIPFFRGR